MYLVLHGLKSGNSTEFKLDPVFSAAFFGKSRNVPPNFFGAAFLDNLKNGCGDYTKTRNNLICLEAHVKFLTLIIQSKTGANSPEYSES